MTYQEALEIRRKWYRGAAAEYTGFMDAGSSTKRTLMFEAQYEQQRYEQGYTDGTAILEVYGVSA